MAPTTPAGFCTRCGLPISPEGQAISADGHEACARALTLEPPRYCAQCRRRMVVQVVPAGWTARCSVHGELRS